MALLKDEIASIYACLFSSSTTKESKGWLRIVEMELSRLTGISLKEAGVEGIGAKIGMEEDGPP